MTSCLDLVRADPAWLERRILGGRSWWIFCVAAIVMGSGLYGMTIGLWRDPLQGLYTGLKLPMVMFLTIMGNALINGMMAQWYGSRISFRASSLAMLTSFALASIVLGSLSPVTFFFLLNTAPSTSGNYILSHNALLLMHICIIAFAGVVSNARLYRFLRRQAGSPGAAWRTLSSWLAANLFLGCQVSWILRPFVGSPELSVVFLRENALEGNFYELAFDALTNVLNLQ